MELERSSADVTPEFLGVTPLSAAAVLTFKGKPIVMQPDDSFDDYAYGQERTQSNPPALPRAERRAAAGMHERTRTGGNVFLNRVAQVLFLSGPP